MGQQPRTPTCGPTLMCGERVLVFLDVSIPSRAPCTQGWHPQRSFSAGSIYLPILVNDTAPVLSSNVRAYYRHDMASLDTRSINRVMSHVMRHREGPQAAYTENEKMNLFSILEQ